MDHRAAESRVQGIGVKAGENHTVLVRTFGHQLLVVVVGQHQDDERDREENWCDIQKVQVDPAQNFVAHEQERACRRSGHDCPPGAPCVGAFPEDAGKVDHHDRRHGVGEHHLQVLEQRSEVLDLRRPERGQNHEDAGDPAPGHHQAAAGELR